MGVGCCNGFCQLVFIYCFPHFFPGAISLFFLLAMLYIYMKFVVGFVGQRYYHITDMFSSMRCVSGFNSLCTTCVDLLTHFCGPRCLLFLRSLYCISASNLDISWDMTEGSTLAMHFPSVIGIAHGVTCPYFESELAFGGPFFRRTPVSSALASRY